MNYDFRSSFEDEPRLLNSEPRWTVFHLQFGALRKNESDNPFCIMCFKEQKMILKKHNSCIFFNLIFSTESLKFPRGNRIHNGLSEDTLMKGH